MGHRRAFARHEALPHAPPGGKPPETPGHRELFWLTGDGLLMEAATVREAGLGLRTWWLLRTKTKVGSTAMWASDSSLSSWAVDCTPSGIETTRWGGPPGQCSSCLPPPFTRRVTRCPSQRRRRQA